MLKKSSKDCDTGFITITKLNSRWSVISTSTMSNITAAASCPSYFTLSRMFDVMFLPYATKPRIETGRYMLTTPTYAQNTEIGNLEHFFMSVWIVGKVEAPPNENNIVPKAKRKGEIKRTQQHWGMNIRFTLDKTYHPHLSCEILATQWIALTDDWNVNVSQHILVKKSCHFLLHWITW